MSLGIYQALGIYGSDDNPIPITDDISDRYGVGDFYSVVHTSYNMIDEYTNTQDQVDQVYKTIQNIEDSFNANHTVVSQTNYIASVADQFNSVDDIGTKLAYSTTVDESIGSTDYDTTDRLISEILTSSYDMNDTQQIKFDFLGSYIEALQLQEEWATIAYSLSDISDNTKTSDEYKNTLIKLANVIDNGTDISDRFASASKLMSFTDDNVSIATIAIATATIVAELESSSNFGYSLDVLKSTDINISNDTVLQSDYDVTMTKILITIFGSYSTKDIVEYEKTTVATVNETFSTVDEYILPTGVGMLNVVMFIKAHLTCETST